jgi:hypothetical protein
MARALSLTNASQSLGIDTVTDLSIAKFSYPNTETREPVITEVEVVIARNESTNAREILLTSQLVNLNGFVFSTLVNSVLEVQ